MNATLERTPLVFERPPALQATEPPEERGSGRDDVRLLVSDAHGHHHAPFRALPQMLRRGDLLVVNRSATLPASLPARRAAGAFTLNLSTRYGPALWLAEPRLSPATPGPLPLEPGEALAIAGVPARAIAPYPGIPRLWFVRPEGDLVEAMRRHGAPIRYGYLSRPQPLEAYQTTFASVPGSAEMPSAGRPFTPALLAELERAGIERADLILHTGVSSLELDDLQHGELYPEPYRLPAATAAAVNRARDEGRRVIAVGTTVVRALESALEGGRVRPSAGFTRRLVHPGNYGGSVDGLLTGLHDPGATHLAMLHAVAGRERVMEGYREAVAHGYLWHEFGDSHLIFAS